MDEILKNSEDETTRNVVVVVSETVRTFLAVCSVTYQNLLEGVLDSCKEGRDGVQTPSLR